MCGHRVDLSASHLGAYPCEIGQISVCQGHSVAMTKASAPVQAAYSSAIMPLHKTGMARLIEYAGELAGHQAKLTFQWKESRTP